MNNLIAVKYDNVYKEGFSYLIIDKKKCDFIITDKEPNKDIPLFELYEPEDIIALFEKLGYEKEEK